MNNEEKKLFKQFLIKHRIRKKFIKNYNSRFFSHDHPISLRSFLNSASYNNVIAIAFDWELTPEGFNFWSRMCFCKRLNI